MIRAQTCWKTTKRPLLLQATKSMIASNSRYIDHRTIGSGAYGEVFVATDSTLNRQVAIKRYFKSASDLVEVVSALENWSKLNHPHIAQVLDYSDQDGQLNLVMTYCSNASLDQGVSVLKSDQGKVARLFLQIASAVGYMHGKGLIHRDIKLANVLLDSTNSPVLIDLDLSIRDDSPEIGKMAGTPYYMAPELLDGSAPSSRLTDQYALAVMLFEMLSGNLVNLQPEANSGTDLSNRSFVLNSAIARLRDWNAVIAKATNTDPKARYISISDFSDDVEKLITGKQISAREQSRVERFSLWIRKNPSTGALLSGIAASLILGFLITSFSWSRTISARKSIVSNTDLLKQRIEEAKLRQNELASLLTTVQQELTQAESAEKQQQQVTKAAQESQEKWQAEAERAKLLTAELDSLLVKANASAKNVVVAQKRSDAAVARLSVEQQKEREQNLRNVWNSVDRQKWDEASRLFELLPHELSGIEYQIIFNAIANKLREPTCIQLGTTRKQFSVVDVFEKKNLRLENRSYYTDTYSFKEPCINTIRFSKLSSDRVEAYLNAPSGGSISIYFYIRNQRESPKIHGLLADGSLLVSEGDVCYVVTFAPQNYSPWKANTPRDKMNPEMEEKIEATLIPLSKPQGTGGANQLPKVQSGNTNQLLATKGKPAPPGLDPSEAKAWEYCGSIAAQVNLTSDNRNIISIQSSERAAFDHNEFSAVASLSRLTHAHFAQSGITDQCLVSLAKCTELQVIDLASTGITDVGVQELTSLGALKSLNISNTKASLEGIDNSLLGSLEFLHMNGTTLSPTRFAKLACCKNLRNIDFTGINIEASDLAVLKSLSSLKSLSVSGRNVSLEGIDESVLGNLNSLVLSDIRLGPSRLSKLANCKSLHTLHLSSKDIAEQDLVILKKLYALEYLTIKGMEFSFESLDEALLKNLRGLTLDGVSLGPSRLSKLAACKNLTNLTMQSTNINDEDLVVLASTPMLKVLRLSNAPITDKGLDILEGKKDLRIISLQSTSVSLERVEQLRKTLPNCQVTFYPGAGRSNTETNPVPTGLDSSELKAWNYFMSVSAKVGLSDDKTHIVRLEHKNRAPISVNQFSNVDDLTMLKHGDFAFSQVDDECLLSIAKCSQLEHLNFWSASRVTDVGIGHLNKLPKLTFLNIGFTQASLEAIDDGVLQNLELLYLNNTKLGSSRLSKLSNCKKLRTLAIYLMKINDEDLEVLKQLPALVALEVGTATITDRGLDTIDQLSTLKHLDLRGTPVSDTKVEEFRRKHPECKILR